MYAVDLMICGMNEWAPPKFNRSTKKWEWKLCGLSHWLGSFLVTQLGIFVHTTFIRLRQDSNLRPTDVERALNHCAYFFIKYTEHPKNISFPDKPNLLESNRSTKGDGVGGWGGASQGDWSESQRGLALMRLGLLKQYTTKKPQLDPC